MCGSMVDIQCPIAEIRRGNKKDRKKKPQDENIYVRILLCRAATRRRKKPQDETIMVSLFHSAIIICAKTKD